MQLNATILRGYFSNAHKKGSNSCRIFMALFEMRPCSPIPFGNQLLPLASARKAPSTISIKKTRRCVRFATPFQQKILEYATSFHNFSAVFAASP